MAKSKSPSPRVTYNTIAKSHKAPRIPSAMTRQAEIWMDLYCAFLADLVDSDATQERNLEMVSQARVLADKAMTEVEERWPGVKL